MANNRRWRHIYLHYALYILNERINHKGTNLYEANDSFTEGIEDQNEIYFEADRERKDYVREEVLFDRNSCYIHAAMMENQLQIRKVSKNLEVILHYTADEIVGERLNILLDQELSLVHDQKVAKWL